MSSNPLSVTVRNLAKRYRIADSQAKVTTAGEALMNQLRNPMRRTVYRDFWALRDIDFDVHRGEVIGIIGRNGAGKSTLLKILSRITEPTTGRIDLYGRVGSLLEVGTGFHSELTGRENIFLNGAILGMKRSEIRSQMDAIVEFAEVNRFLDTPVKRYSSGMFVRLAFAVAAHLNPEILIVDEVLAVGDVAFQKKCLGKMEDVAQSGRTVFFVSHHLPSVQVLCTRVLYLKNGELVCDGHTSEVVDQYIRDGLDQPFERRWNVDEAPGRGGLRLRYVRVYAPSTGVSSSAFDLSEPIGVEFEIDCALPGRYTPSIQVLTSQGTCVFSSSNIIDPEWGTAIYETGSYKMRCTIPGYLLNDGHYSITVFVNRDVAESLIVTENAAAFLITDDGSGRGDYVGPWAGVTRPQLKWSVEQIPGAFV